MVERHLTRERSWRFITNLIGVIIVGDSISGASLQGLVGGLGTDAERPRGRVTLGRRSRPRVRRKLSDLSTKTHDKLGMAKDRDNVLSEFEALKRDTDRVVDGLAVIASDLD